MSYVWKCRPCVCVCVCVCVWVESVVVMHIRLPWIYIHIRWRSVISSAAVVEFGILYKLREPVFASLEPIRFQDSFRPHYRRKVLTPIRGEAFEGLDLN